MGHILAFKNLHNRPGSVLDVNFLAVVESQGEGVNSAFG